MVFLKYFLAPETFQQLHKSTCQQGTLPFLFPDKNVDVLFSDEDLKKQNKEKRKRKLKQA